MYSICFQNIIKPCRPQCRVDLKRCRPYTKVCIVCYKINCTSCQYVVEILENSPYVEMKHLPSFNINIIRANSLRIWTRS